MNITFKLFATLTDYLPAEARRSNQVTLDVAQDASINQIIEPFGMPPKLVHLVLVNGKYIKLLVLTSSFRKASPDKL